MPIAWLDEWVWDMESNPISIFLFQFQLSYELCSMCTDLKFFVRRNVATAQQHHIISGFHEFLSFPYQIDSAKSWNELKKVHCDRLRSKVKRDAVHSSPRAAIEALTVTPKPFRFVPYPTFHLSFLFSSFLFTCSARIFLPSLRPPLLAARAPFLIQKSPKPIAEEAHQIR